VDHSEGFLPDQPQELRPIDLDPGRGHPQNPRWLGGDRTPRCLRRALADRRQGIL